MEPKRATIGGGCFVAWLFATLLAVAFGFAVFFLVMAGLGESGGPIPNWIASLILTGCLGTVIALAQWALLRRYVQASGLWIAVTLLGFLVSSPVLISRGGNFGPYIVLQGVLGMSATLGAVLGILQWLVLRKKVRRDALWIGISFVSWVLAGLAGMALKGLSYEMGPILYWIGVFFFGILLSGVGLMWLLRGVTPPADNPLT